MIALLLTLTSFAAFTAAGLWATRALSAAQRESQARVPAPPAEPEDPWIARPDAASIAGTHVWAGQTTAGVLHTPADCAAIVVGPPKAGKTRKVIAPTLACWDGPALVTSTKGDILQTAAHRARLGPVAVYDPTGSLGARRSASASRRCRGVRRGTARLRWPPRCCPRPPRMRASVMASTSRSPHARCWRRCFMRRRFRTAGSTGRVDGWGARSSPSPRRSCAARGRRGA